MNAVATTSTIRNRRGFTFAEVMFAVILLGIGFIMLAGMFPVAIQQTQLTQEETAGGNIAHSAANLIAQVATEANGFAVTNAGYLEQLPTGSNRALSRLHGDQIHSADRRYGWTALYRRNTGDDFIQVVIIAAQVRNAPEFTPFLADQDLISPVLIDGQINVTKGDITKAAPLDRDSVIFKPQTDKFYWQEHLTTGAFVTFAAAGGPIRVYRLGEQIDGSFLNSGEIGWYIAPGYELGSANEQVPTPKIAPPPNVRTSVHAFVLGRGADPAAKPSDPPVGPAMDIAVYVTSIPLKK